MANLDAVAEHVNGLETRVRAQEEIHHPMGACAAMRHELRNDEQTAHGKLWMAITTLQERMTKVEVRMGLICAGCSLVGSVAAQVAMRKLGL